MIILEFITGPEDVIGIPNFVTVSVSDSSALLYYTLDGTTPTPFSTPVTGPIKIQKTAGVVSLSVVAYISDGLGGLLPAAVLTEIYRSDLADYYVNYSIHGGLAYIFPGGRDIPFWYDSVGEASTFIDIDQREIDFFPRVRNADGSYNETAWFNYLAPPDIDRTAKSYLTNDDYRPKAAYLVIDSRDDSPNPPARPVYNGAYMTLRNPKTYYRGLDYASTGQENHVSGHFVRAFYSEKTKTYVSYYYDTVDSRWIKSLSTLELQPIQSRTIYTVPLVFRWNIWGTYNSW